MKKLFGFLLLLGFVSSARAQVGAESPRPTPPGDAGLASRREEFVIRRDDGSTQSGSFSFDLTGAPEQPQAACTATATVLCLNGGRFKLTVTWRAVNQGTSGVGTAVPVTSDTGYFWFFSASNIELVIKALDGRAFNSAFWIFYGALSDVEYTITVVDLVTGATKTYTNQQGRLASVADTSAFPSSANCSYGISPSSQNVAVGGGSGSAGVTAPGGCPWIASSNDSWITITSGTPGNGNGTVAFTVASNPNAGSRTGTLTVAGQTFTVTQSGTSSGVYNGNWQGTTSHGKTISFTIVNDAFTSFSIGYAAAGSGCTADGTSTITYTTPKPITGSSFTITTTGFAPSALSYTVIGTFNSSTSASGTASFTLIQSTPLPICNATGSSTWNSTKS
jgi:hypothetical protein